MTLQTLIITIHVLVSLALVGLVLIQRGKGAEAGAAFGSGASQTVFGARGSASFLTRTTAILATIFFITSLSLAYFTQRGTAGKSVTEIAAPAATVQDESQTESPAVPDDVPAVPAPDSSQK
jgi:preprotein translocase subunit SecG